MFEAVMSMGTLPRHDPAKLEGGERVEAVVARERLIARLQAEQAELVAPHAAETAPVGGLRGAAGEVALARGGVSGGGGASGARRAGAGL